MGCAAVLPNRPWLRLERSIVSHSRPRLCLELSHVRDLSQARSRFSCPMLPRFSHAADVQMRCIQVRHKCQGMSLLMPLSRSKNQIPLCRRPARSEA
jgi:hypothetical protein